jgi:tRNA A37 threonylcarbamoyladenosine biosynthesis protein TsaE
MEWSDRWPEVLPERHLKVRIAILNEHSREITLSGSHSEAVRILEEMKREVA